MIKEFLITRAYAADEIPDTPIVGSTFENLTISGLFLTAVNLIIMIGLGLVLVFLALGFIKFITSQGDKVATEQAQKWITYAVIGGVGLFAVFAIKTLIQSLTGYENDVLNF